ncbi:unnamed protein product [Mytilus coruscus]|uniref:Uncharacterized protein n=1 Tax=Mytilus coruscus TaxID=42192 RepID=A0A6J8ETQ0_MYTCO|nr:unnamed protein product [Mytilus coruscus]
MTSSESLRKTTITFFSTEIDSVQIDNGHTEEDSLQLCDFSHYMFKVFVYIRDRVAYLGVCAMDNLQFCRLKAYIKKQHLKIILLLKISNAVFNFQCPDQSQWKHRANAYCDSFNSYFCLYDRNEKNFTEFCRESPDFETPGYKLLVACSFQGTLDGDSCDHDFYQPFKFLSSGNSRCVHKTSYCNEEGQVVYSNGTVENDILCRCDYTKGYDFIIRPKHPRSCVPSEEDCSCYHKRCSAGYILPPGMLGKSV